MYFCIHRNIRRNLPVFLTLTGKNWTKPVGLRGRSSWQTGSQTGIKSFRCIPGQWGAPEHAGNRRKHLSEHAAGREIISFPSFIGTSRTVCWHRMQRNVFRHCRRRRAFWKPAIRNCRKNFVKSPGRYVERHR